MERLKALIFLLVSVLLLQMVGCGGGTNSGSVFSKGVDSPDTPLPDGTVLSYNLVLSLTPTSGVGTTVGPNSTVIATAILKDSDGKPVANQPVRFEAIDGPVTINPAIVTTDSSGKAINFLTAGATTTSAIDVIIKASVAINSQSVTAIGVFKIMRSESNIIKFITTKNPTDPDGTLNTVKVVLEAVPPTDPPEIKTLLQLVPFQIVDNNGVPRGRVPVTVSVYSEIGDCPVFIDSPETVEKTVTTDDTGLGIFNAGVDLEVPAIGSQNACSIIYKAVAADPNNATETIYSYGGFIAVLENVRIK